MKVPDIREATPGLVNARRATSRIVLAALAVFGAAAFGATPAAAWTDKQIAAHQRYLACKTTLQKDPPCNNNWTRQCRLRCRGRLI